MVQNMTTLILLIGAIALVGLFSFLGFRRFRRRFEQTDKELDSLREQILTLKIRMLRASGRKRKPKQTPGVVQFPDRALGG
jgi:LPXTG-motif cell wall-anchored protein